MRKIVFTFVALSLLPSSSALAQVDPERDERARLHFQAGSSHFDTGDYAAAAHEFRAAYELSQRPALLFNIYTAHERLGELDAAVRYLERFLEEAPETENLASLAIRLERLRERAARAEPEPQPEPAAPSPRERPLLVPAIVSLAVAGAGLLTFAIFGSLALAEDGEVGARCGAMAGRTCGDEDLGPLVTYTAMADVGWVLALAAGALGAVFLVIDALDEDSEDMALAPWASPLGAGLSLTGGF